MLMQCNGCYCADARLARSFPATPQSSEKADLAVLVNSSDMFVAPVKVSEQGRKVRNAAQKNFFFTLLPLTSSHPKLQKTWKHSMH